MAKHNAIRTDERVRLLGLPSYAAGGIALTTAGFLIATVAGVPDLTERQAAGVTDSQTRLAAADVTLLASTQAAIGDGGNLVQGFNPTGFVEYLKESYALRPDAVEAVTEYLKDGLTPQDGIVAGIPQYVIDGWTIQPDATDNLLAAFQDPEVYEQLLLLIAPNAATGNVPGVAAALILIGSDAVFGEHSIPSHYLSGYAALGPAGLVVAGALVGSDIVFGTDSIPSALLDELVHTGVFAIAPVALDLSRLIFAEDSVPADAAEAYFNGFPFDDPQATGFRGLGRFALAELGTAFDVLTQDPPAEEGEGDASLVAGQGAATAAVQVADTVTQGNGSPDDEVEEDLTSEPEEPIAETDDGDKSLRGRAGGLGGLHPLKKVADVVKRFTGGGDSDAAAADGGDSDGES